MAMEKEFGRHRAEVKTLAGVYGAAYEGDEGFAAIQKSVEDFADAEGRRPRMLVVKMGQDGHDRGAKVIATALPISVLTWTLARCSKRRKRLHRMPSTTMCISWASARKLPVTRRWPRNW